MVHFMYHYLYKKNMASKKGEEIPLLNTTGQVGVKAVPADVIQKLQAIAGIEGYTNNELYNLAFVKLIESYEKLNGKLKLRPKGKGLEGI